MKKSYCIVIYNCPHFKIVHLHINIGKWLRTVYNIYFQKYFGCNKKIGYEEKVIGFNE